MHRCYAEPALWAGDGIRLPDDEAHHLLKVLRARAGERVLVIDGRGRECEAVIEGEPGERPGRAGMRLCPVPGTLRQEAPGPMVTLAAAIIKGPRMDFLIEKAVELGVSRIQPLFSQRVVAGGERDAKGGRQERWSRLAVSAAKQCGNPWVPLIEAPQSLEAWRGKRGNGLLLLGSLDPSATPLSSVITAGAGGGITLLIGPEGDFSPEETRILREDGAIPVSFGRRVLRAETAALAGLAIIMHALESGCGQAGG